MPILILLNFLANYGHFGLSNSGISRVEKKEKAEVDVGIFPNDRRPQNCDDIQSAWAYRTDAQSSALEQEVAWLSAIALHRDGRFIYSLDTSSSRPIPSLDTRYEESDVGWESRVNEEYRGCPPKSTYRSGLHYLRDRGLVRSEDDKEGSVELTPVSWFAHLFERNIALLVDRHNQGSFPNEETVRSFGLSAFSAWWETIKESKTPPPAVLAGMDVGALSLFYFGTDTGGPLARDALEVRYSPLIVDMLDEALQRGSLEGDALVVKELDALPLITALSRDFPFWNGRGGPTLSPQDDALWQLGVLSVRAQLDQSETALPLVNVTDALYTLGRYAEAALLLTDYASALRTAESETDNEEKKEKLWLEYQATMVWINFFDAMATRAKQGKPVLQTVAIYTPYGIEHRPLCSQLDQLYTCTLFQELDPDANHDSPTSFWTTLLEEIPIETLSVDSIKTLPDPALQRKAFALLSALQGETSWNDKHLPIELRLLFWPPDNLAPHSPEEKTLPISGCSANRPAVDYAQWEAWIDRGAQDVKEKLGALATDSPFVSRILVAPCDQGLGSHNGWSGLLQIDPNKGIETATVRHEFVHAYLSFLGSSPGVTRWFNEGMATYYGEWLFDPNRELNTPELPCDRLDQVADPDFASFPEVDLDEIAGEYCRAVAVVSSMAFTNEELPLKIASALKTAMRDVQNKRDALTGPSEAEAWLNFLSKQETGWAFQDLLLWTETIPAEERLE